MPERATASPAGFWRLLGDYERICNDETAALRAEDFESAATIQALKATLLAGLQEKGRELGIDRSDSSFRERLEAIASSEQANEAFVAKLLTRNATERISLDAARIRLRGLRHSYASYKPVGSGSFFARG